MLKTFLQKTFFPSRQPEQLLSNVDSFLAGQRISRGITERGGFLASRLGFTEALCLAAMDSGGLEREEIRARLWKYSGVFPDTESQLEKFKTVYCAAIGEIDLLGLIQAIGEKNLIEKHAVDPLMSPLSALEPYLSPKPWSIHLKGCRVLVVHPFVDSIRAQFSERRTDLFADPDVLPEFELLTIRSPQTIAGNSDRHRSWSAALENLQERVSGEHFDVAIVGCGAYGLPLGSFIKKLGKPCIHLGGATQVLFGIRGARWQNQPAFRALMTAAWRSPLESERPAGFEKVEKGCYW